MRTGIIIQARLGSTRLPRKMILPFFDDQGILEILLIRLKEVIYEKVTPIILATTTNPMDDELQKIGDSLGISTVRGSENDVLGRFIDAAEKHNITNIIRVCADNPLLDLAKLLELIERSEKSMVDYCSFSTSVSKPTILTSYGFWAEAVSLEALKKVAVVTDERIYHEHVTNYVYKHPDQFTVAYKLINPEIEKEENIRLTVDTQSDFDLVKVIYKDLIDCKVEFNAEKIVKHIGSRPDWMETMKTEILANKK
jgi:spore coat polysaccharide biosynthesis protein SpsF